MYTSVSPIPAVLDQRAKALNDGRLFVGLPDQDPELFPKAIFWDEAGTDPIDQSDGVEVIGGYVRRSGSPALIYVTGNYSMRVRDRFGVQVYYVASVTDVNDIWDARFALFASSAGAGLVGYGSNSTYADGTVGNELVPRVTLALLPAVSPKASKVAFLQDAGREGHFICRVGSPPSDPLQGIYVQSNTLGFYWERIWDKVTAKAEWFGALANGSDDAPAINAAIVLCPETQLEARDYWVSSPIKISISGRVLRGVGQQYVDAPAQCTRILTADATMTIIQVGADTFPGAVNAMIRGPSLYDMYVGRVVGPNIASNCAGVSIQFCIAAEVKRVKSVDSIHSFRFYGSVAPYVEQCNANRVTAGAGAGTDNWSGYMIDGSPSIGLAGGNGSIYLEKTQAGCNNAALQMGDSTGYRLVSGFQDTFLLDTESVSCNVGISLEGGHPANADVIIANPIVDACYKWGIFISNLSLGASVNITDPYVGCRASTQFCLYVSNTLGAVNVQGGQFLCATGTSISAAIAIGGTTGSRSVKVAGTIIINTRGTAVSIGESGSTCRNISVRPVVVNDQVSSTTAAILIAGAIQACDISPMVDGGADAFASGIRVNGTGDARNEYNLTGINSACIAGGSANKLIRNAVQIVATGLTGTNLVSGVVT